MGKAPQSRSHLLEGIGECLHSWGCVEIEVSNLYMILQGVKRDDFSHKTEVVPIPWTGIQVS